jgi:diacylglycerol kinase (ATP)
MENKERVANKFSWAKRAKSFRHAFAGIWNFVLREHNARLHFLATILVLIAAVLVKLTPGEEIGVAVAIGFVWVAEMFNTSLEKLVDLISLEERPDIRYIKDVAAGAVLVASITALIIGMLIFIPKIHWV